MTLKRIYTFDEEAGLGSDRVSPTIAQPEDDLLAPLALTNWQLAILITIGLLGTATSSEIGYALVMDRDTVSANLLPLEKRRAVRQRLIRKGRGSAYELGTAGPGLLEQGTRLWRAAHPACPLEKTGSGFASIG